MTIRSVGIIGYGSFGKLLHALAGRFAPSVRVKVHSSSRSADGVTFFSLEETAACDAVIFTVPISAFEATLARILPHARPDTVLVDVATVKQHTVAVLERLAPGRPFVAMHPMWGPESYEKRGGDIGGFRIVLAAHTLPEAAYGVLKEALRGIGFDVVEMSPEQHDRHLAETLFLTHFVGQIVADAGFNRTEIDTVSFGFLMDAVESVKHDTALFRDVYRFNPYCADVLERFQISEMRVRDVLKAE